jgi:hypothetical protein
MRYGQQPNRKQTFQDERSYKYAINEDTNEIFLVMPDKSLVPLENPYYLLLAEQMGFYTPKKPEYFKLKPNQDKRFTNDDDYQNAFGDGIKKIGKQVTNGVKDFIEDPKQAIKNLGRELKIGKEKLGNRIKSKVEDAVDLAGRLAKGIRDAKALKKIAFSAQRQAFLGLVAVNFQGFATRYFLRSDEDRKAIIDSWEEKWGGDRGSLEGAFNTGKDKLPLFISKRKRQDMIRKQDELADNNWANALAESTIVALIGLAISLITWMVNMFVQRKVRKDQEKKEQEILDAQKNADNNDPVTTPIDYELVEIQRQIDAINANPNLDQEQKDILINELRGVIPQQTWWDKNKLWVIVSSGGVVLLGTLAFLLYKRNQQQ